MHLRDGANLDIYCDVPPRSRIGIVRKPVRSAGSAAGSPLFAPRRKIHKIPSEAATSAAGSPLFAPRRKIHKIPSEAASSSGKSNPLLQLLGPLPKQKTQGFRPVTKPKKQTSENYFNYKPVKSASGKKPSFVDALLGTPSTRGNTSANEARLKSAIRSDTTEEFIREATKPHRGKRVSDETFFKNLPSVGASKKVATPDFKRGWNSKQKEIYKEVSDDIFFAGLRTPKKSNGSVFVEKSGQNDPVGQALREAALNRPSTTDDYTIPKPQRSSRGWNAKQKQIYKKVSDDIFFAGLPDAGVPANSTSLNQFFDDLAFRPLPPANSIVRSAEKVEAAGEKLSSELRKSGSVGAASAVDAAVDQAASAAAAVTKKKSKKRRNVSREYPGFGDRGRKRKSKTTEAAPSAPEIAAAASAVANAASTVEAVADNADKENKIPSTVATAVSTKAASAKSGLSSLGLSGLFASPAKLTTQAKELSREASRLSQQIAATVSNAPASQKSELKALSRKASSIAAASSRSQTAAAVLSEAAALQDVADKVASVRNTPGAAAARSRVSAVTNRVSEKVRTDSGISSKEASSVGGSLYDDVLSSRGTPQVSSVGSLLDSILAPKSARQSSRKSARAASLSNVSSAGSLFDDIAPLPLPPAASLLETLGGLPPAAPSRLLSGGLSSGVSRSGTYATAEKSAAALSQHASRLSKASEQLARVATSGSSNRGTASAVAASAKAAAKAASQGNLSAAVSLSKTASSQASASVRSSLSRSNASPSAALSAATSAVDAANDVIADVATSSKAASLVEKSQSLLSQASRTSGAEAAELVASAAAATENAASIVKEESGPGVAATAAAAAGTAAQAGLTVLKNLWWLGGTAAVAATPYLKAAGETVAAATVAGAKAGAAAAANAAVGGTQALVGVVTQAQARRLESAAAQAATAVRTGSSAQVEAAEDRVATVVEQTVVAAPSVAASTAAVVPPSKEVINKMTKPGLIELCEHEGLSTSGTVPQLRARLIEHFYGAGKSLSPEAAETTGRPKRTIKAPLFWNSKAEYEKYYLGKK